jgi:predicted Zn-dependent protease
MDNLFFWNSWNKANRILFLFLLSLFTFGLMLVVLCYFIGDKGVVDVEIYSKLENIKVTIDEFSRNLLNFPVLADSYIIKEWYGASPIKILPLYSYVFAGIVLIAILFILTSITFIDSLLWYTLGMAGFILFLVNLNTELLNIFSPNSRYFLIGLVIIYGGLSYYFKAFRENLSFQLRLSAFLIITLILGLALYHLSNDVQAPFFYISNYGIPTAIVLSLLFIMLTAYDVIQGFFYLLTSSKNINTKNITLNFTLGSILFLANFLLLLFKKLQLVDLDILYLNPFLALFFSSIIGIWGFKQKEILFKNIFSFQPLGALVYLSMGIICFFTIAYCFITGNDSFIETLEYGIIYSNLCIGSTFLIYVLLNFSDLFNKNIPQLYKRIYQPRRTPFFVVYAGGIFAMGSLFLQSNQLPHSIYQAGYLNNVGDVYLYEKDYLLAREYYINAVSNDYDNWRSNYTLGYIALNKDEIESAVNYYAKSSNKHASEYSYLNLSNIYVDKDHFFPAKFALEDGLKKFPKSSMLYNNLALLYAKTALLDSCVYFLQVAKKYSDEEVPKTNLLYFLVKHKILHPADSLFQENSTTTGAGFLANGLSNFNSLSKKFQKDIKDVLHDSVLTNQTFACIYNYGINKIKQGDQDFIKKIETLEKSPSNSPYAEDLRYLTALYYYYNGDKAKGVRLLEELKNYAGNSATIYSNTLGMWLMENNLQSEAAENLKQAISLRDQDTYLNYCIALAEAGKKEEALTAFEPLRIKGSKDIMLISNNLAKIISINRKDSALSLEEPLRLQYFHLRIKELSEYDILSIYSSFTNERSKYFAAAELMNFYLDKNEIDKCRQIWYANEHDLSKEDIALGLMNLQYLRFLSMDHNYQELQKIIEPIYLNKTDEPIKNYFKALVAESNKSMQLAENLFNSVLKTNPFNEDVVLGAAHFYNVQNKTLEAYNILVEAQHIHSSSVKILQAYALQSLKINLESYGEITLNKLKDLMNEKDFRAFKNYYDQQKTVF